MVKFLFSLHSIIRKNQVSLSSHIGLEDHNPSINFGQWIQALFASWEPRHPRHCYRHPWKQYVKLGVVLRHFGFTAVSLHGCLESEIQVPRSVQALLKDPCIRIAGAVAKVLCELANCINKWCHCSQDSLSNHLHEVLQDLNATIKSQPRLFFGSNHGHPKTFSVQLPKRNMRDSITDHLSNDKDKKELRTTLSNIAITSHEFSEVLPFAAFASLLVEMVVGLELVIEQVVELGKMACFKEFDEEPDIEIIVSCERKHFDSPHLAPEAAE